MGRALSPASVAGMNLSETIWFATLVVVLCAGYIDWRTRRIPNWLTVSGFLLGIALNSIISGWHGAVGSLEGAGLALGLLLPLVLLRGFGAGDWKLLGAVGSLMGWRAMLVVLIVSSLVTGAAALVQVIAAGRFKATFKNIGTLLKGFAIFGLRPNPEISLDNPRLAKLPFGTCVAVGTALCFLATHWPQ
jgi:prepilin peptidase CpaA